MLVLAFLVVPAIDELLLLIVAAYMHFEEVILCCDVGVHRNQVDATKVGAAVILTCEAGHISGRVAFLIDADSQIEGNLYQLELKPCCLPAVGEGARKNNDIVSVEVEGVVLGWVLMSWQAVLRAADFAKPPWILFLLAEENICVVLEDVEVCC